jgi:hypothetical protein
VLIKIFLPSWFYQLGISGLPPKAAQDMANHSDPRTTKLYDRRKDLATLSEIERRISF